MFLLNLLNHLLNHSFKSLNSCFRNWITRFKNKRFEFT